MTVSIDASTRTWTRTADERLEEFKAFVRIPTVGVLSEHASDVRAGAAWLAARMRRDRPGAHRSL